MKGVILFLLVCFVVAIFASCPLECVHGSCHDDECSCDSNYVGDDCSAYSETIEEGGVYSGEVDQTQWRFYPLETDDVETITWTLTLNSDNSDCDLYVNANKYPSLFDFVAANISILDTLTVTIPDAQPGNYIAGVYGFTDCSYTIQASFSSPCPNDCSNHGTCNSEQMCECGSGYLGEDCGVVVVTPGVESQGYAPDLFSWSYFAFVADKYYQSLEWVVTPIDSEDHNCEMFISTDQAPTFFSFDATKFGFSNDPISLSETEVEEGHTYYMSVNGLFGYVACNFSAILHTNSPDSPTECPNNCSYHATSSTCNNNKCTCESSYTGEECEEYTESITLDQAYTGYVGNDAWNYYHFDADTENSLIVTLKRTTSSGDVDLYVGDGAKPSLFDFTYSNISIGTTMTVEIQEPAGQTWYFGVFGWDSANYSLTVKETTSCPCVDSYHGSCNDNPEVCECNSGYAGDDCGNPLTALVSGQPLVNQVVGLDEWNYYSIAVGDASAASLTVKEDGEVGVAWVFVGFNEFPTATDYVYNDKNHHNATHQINYSAKEEQTGELYIGVYGSPFIPEVDGESTVEYEIVCWVSDF